MTSCSARAIFYSPSRILSRNPYTLMNYSLGQWALLYGSLLGSMLLGATVTHSILRPDLQLKKNIPKTTTTGN
jgi:hypothetical protein